MAPIGQYKNTTPESDYSDNITLSVISAPTASWNFSQDLGNLGVSLGFGDFAMQSWEFLLS